MRFIGIDFGRARIGVALGDTETKISSPWRVLENGGDADAIASLVQIAKEERADGFVIGIPRPLGDQTRETDQAKEIRAFGHKLAEAGLPVHEADETLTSALAERQVAEMGGRGKRDDLAAAAILQGYLDRSF